MNIQNKIIIMAIATCITMLFSCQTDKNEEEAEAVALNFATNYFGCHYIEASHLCTPESEQWIKFVATNVSDSDLAVLNASEATPTYEVTDLSLDNDSNATCTITARNYLMLHDICTKGHIADEGCYKLTLTRQNGKWLVNLDGVPCAEAQ